MHRLLLPVIALIVYGSLYPWRFDFSRTQADPLWILLHAWPAKFDKFLLRDAAVNLALYFPLGLTAVLALLRRHGRILAVTAALLLAVLLSASMEMLQIFDETRYCSLVDVLTNVIGAAAGALAALAFRPNLENLARHKPARRAAAAAVLLACWAGYQLFPLVPLLSRAKWRAGWALLAQPDSLSAVEVWASAAEWFAAALVLAAIFGRMRTWWLLAAMSCLPLRILIAERSLGLSEVLGAALALLLWIILGQKSMLTVGIWMLASAVLLRELSPFGFSKTPSPFNWIPFAATFEADRVYAALAILRKAFEYGVLVWSLRAIGVSYLRAALPVAAALALLEWVQRYIPGKTPESTDAVLALLMAFVLWTLSDFAQRRGLP